MVVELKKQKQRRLLLKLNTNFKQQTLSGVCCLILLNIRGYRYGRNTGNTGAYNQEELDTLEKAKRIRMGIVDAMVKDGIPDNTREIRLLNEVLMSMESSIHTGVANRIKYVDGQNTANIQATVAETLRQAAIMTAQNKAAITVVDVEELSDEEVVDGEMEINPVELPVSDFMVDLDADSVDDEDEDYEDDDEEEDE